MGGSARRRALTLRVLECVLARVWCDAVCAPAVFCEEGDTEPSGGALDTFWRAAENFQTTSSYPVCRRGVLRAATTPCHVLGQ